VRGEAVLLPVVDATVSLMRESVMPGLFIKGAVAALFVVTLGGCSGDDSDSAADTSTTTVTVPASPNDLPSVTSVPATTPPAANVEIISVTYSGGKVVSGNSRYTVDKGDSVKVEVIADKSDEVHVHGYDKLAAVEPNTPAVIEFTADVPGVFEVELEGSHKLLFNLEVRG
jgi:hypothetical protein